MSADHTPHPMVPYPPEELIARGHPWTRDERGWIDIVGERVDGVVGAPSRFNGAYGTVYDTVMRRSATRDAASRMMWGTGSAIPRLGELIRSVIEDLPLSPVVVDLPCGAGAMWPAMCAAGFRGTLIGCDLSSSMLSRADRTAASLRRPDLDIVLVRGDAHDLQLMPHIADAVFCINGLHCMPDIPAVMRGMQRTLRANSLALVTTMVDDGSRRHRGVARAALAAGVVPAMPPTRETIIDAAQEAGFHTVTDLGGTGIAAFLFGT